ncbi:MAG: hypothetical protein J6M17_09920 [Ruminococcus sp.]|nr:hypothetical protein [Ruminococcus sp.]
MKRNSNFFSRVSDIAKRIFTDTDKDSSISAYMSAMTEEHNEAYEKEYASFAAEYMYS